MPPALKPAAYLDLDGPILDVSVRHYRVYADIVASQGGTPISLEEFWSAKRQKISDREILGRSGLADEPANYKARKLAAIESPAYLAYDRLQLHSRETLHRIALHYRPVLVTLRHSRTALLDQLAVLNIGDFFAAILSGPAGPRPGWETKCALVRENGIAAGPLAFFAGDTETDILAGRALGVSTVAVCNGIREDRLLQAQAPDWLIPTLADLVSTKLLP